MRITQIKTIGQVLAKLSPKGFIKKYLRPKERVGLKINKLNNNNNNNSHLISN